ncbi:MAG: glycosyltransferase family 2 protein [Planctomycetes bacterium]|nr:glycosyltransferase family 2 protein [Planctomycetota bacterium]
MTSDSKQPLVSVGFAVYNRPELLRLAIESIVQQTYENLEIIVSDDCSPGDETRAVVEEFMEKDARIQYCRQEKNIGEAENMKFVLSKAKGEYFMWAAEDDLWEEMFVETGINALLADNFYQAWFCSFDVIDTFGRVVQELPGLSFLTSTSDRRKNIIRYLRTSGNMGKDIMTMGIYETQVLTETVEHYFICGKGVRNRHGCDSAFNIAFLARYNILITDDILFHNSVTRRSVPDEKEKIVLLSRKDNPYRGVSLHRGTFNPKKIITVIREHYRAVKGTQYTKMVVLTLLLIFPVAIKNYLIIRANRKVHSVTKRIKPLIQSLRKTY